MKQIVEAHMEQILVLIGVIVAIVITGWVIVATIDNLTHSDEVEDNNRKEAIEAKVEACTKSDPADIKDCILLLTVEGK